MMVTDPKKIFESMKEPGHIELLLPDELRVFTEYVQKWTVTTTELRLFARPIERARSKIPAIDVMHRRDGLPKQGFGTRWGRHTALTTAMLTYVSHAYHVPGALSAPQRGGA